ncbi:hypothetical protein ACFX13_002326 [Malus domestica]
MAVKRILRYVKTTYNHGLVYKPGTAHLTTYSEVDYAGNPEYRQLAYTAAEDASNLVFHSRTKHLEVDYHYVRENVVRRELLVNFICSQDQVVDLFTKGLSSARFKLLVSKLPVVPLLVSLPGGGGDVRPSQCLILVPVTLGGCNQPKLLSTKS